jgi:hypothetical protein
VAYEVLFTDQFDAWWNGLTVAEQVAIEARVDLLAEHGPALGRPTVDTLEGSHLPNLKELRASTLRVLFVFDPLQQAVLLIGGDKQDQWNEWYRDAIPEAERLYDAYLEELRDEGRL